jgi:hypothetical protein
VNLCFVLIPLDEKNDYIIYTDIYNIKHEIYINPLFISCLDIYNDPNFFNFIINEPVIVDISKCNITRIHQNFLNNNFHLTHIYLPHTLNYISDNFLVNCPNIKTLDLSHTKIYHIGNYFITSNLHIKLHNILLPNTLKTIYSKFLCNTDIKSIDLSHTQLINIYDSFMNNCCNLNYVNLPNTIEFIGSNFLCYTDVKSIDLSHTQLTGISHSFMVNCYNLNYVNLPNTIEYILWNFLCNCTTINSIDLSNTKIKELSYSFMACCHNLKSVKFPRCLKDVNTEPNIGYCRYPIFHQTQIQMLDFRKTNVTYIHRDNFSTCYQLKNVYMKKKYILKNYKFLNMVKKRCYKPIVTTNLIISLITGVI